MSVRKFIAVYTGLWLAAAVVPASADALDDVTARGELICGVLSGVEPFGFIKDPQARQIVGYDVDICTAVAVHLGVKPVLRQMSVDARIPELNQGRIDVLTAALSWTPQRAEQIDFSDAYYMSHVLAVTRPENNATKLADLAGYRISVASGTTAETSVQSKVPKAKILSFPDVPTAFLAFRQGKSEAFAAGDLVLRRFLRDADIKAQVVAEPLQVDPYAIGIRKGEPRLKNAVNAALANLEATGQAKAMFDLWLGPYGAERSFKFGPITALKN